MEDTHARQASRETKVLKRRDMKQGATFPHPGVPCKYETKVLYIHRGPSPATPCDCWFSLSEFTWALYRGSLSPDILCLIHLPIFLHSLLLRSHTLIRKIWRHLTQTCMFQGLSLSLSLSLSLYLSIYLCVCVCVLSAHSSFHFAIIYIRMKHL